MAGTNGVVDLFSVKQNIFHLLTFLWKISEEPFSLVYFLKHVTSLTFGFHISAKIFN